MLLIAEFWQLISQLCFVGTNSMTGGLTSLVDHGVSSMVPEGHTRSNWPSFDWICTFFPCRLVGGLLTLSLDYCFVLEDEDGICGYALGTVDVTPFIKKCKMSWIPFMQEKYTKPNSDKELSEAEVGITCEIRTVCWSLSKVRFCFLSSHEIQLLHLSEVFEHVLKHLMYQKETVKLFIARYSYVL